VTAKYTKLRQVLAESNRTIANSIRVIDDVPSRIELIQYERRFAELYQQVGAVGAVGAVCAMCTVDGGDAVSVSIVSTIGAVGTVGAVSTVYDCAYCAYCG
jgi:hypothetical protein